MVGSVVPDAVGEGVADGEGVAGTVGVGDVGDVGDVGTTVRVEVVDVDQAEARFSARPA